MRRLHAQLARFLTADEDGNPAKKIGHLCADMGAQGYNYAMFTDKMEFDDADVRLETYMKPNCWHFTALTKQLIHDDSIPAYGSVENDTVPDMFNWIVNERFHVDEYAAQHLVFLRYTPPDADVLRQVADRKKLMSYAESQIPWLHRVILQASDIKFFEWHRMKEDGYKGVLVSQRENDREPFGLWNCYPTLAIWDRSLLTPDKTSFHRNAGPFQYRE